MLMPDFSKYSLALIEGNDIIHSSRENGLRPLFDCLERHQGKSGLTLHDKVIGLAAARLIVRSGIIVQVMTTIASMPAKKYLEDNDIQMTACDVTANILTRDKSAVCPGEIIALNTESPEDFLRKIKALLHRQVS